MNNHIKSTSQRSPVAENLSNMDIRLTTLLKNMNPTTKKQIGNLFNCLNVSKGSKKAETMILKLIDGIALEDVCHEMKCMIPIILKKCPDIFDSGWFSTKHTFKYQTELGNVCEFSFSRTSQANAGTTLDRLNFLITGFTNNNDLDKDFFAGAELYDIKIDGGHCSDYNFSNACFKSVDLSGRFANANFSNAIFKGGSMFAKFSNVNLKETTFSGITGFNAKFEECDFTEASIGQRLFNNETTQNKCNFSNAKFSELASRFIECDFSGIKPFNSDDVIFIKGAINFTRCQFIDTDLTKFELDRVSNQSDTYIFIGADLTGATIDENFLKLFTCNSDKNLKSLDSQRIKECIKQCIFTIQSIGDEHLNEKIGLCEKIINSFKNNELHLKVEEEFQELEDLKENLVISLC